LSSNPSTTKKGEERGEGGKRRRRGKLSPGTYCMAILKT
jgi:hypothetical protein